ncbi:MAG: ABC transporter substrate-binding protein [Betaproteobacteria bacterium]|nr:ABC transporter substrate-binding protein [Betaproteobacteria bacterium]
MIGFTLTNSMNAEEISTAPDELIKNVTRDVLEVVRKDRDIQKGNQKRAIELVEAKVVPYFNFVRMTGLALAKDWRSATQEQKKLLAHEFRALLVRTYSKSLSEYRDQAIEFRPLKMNPGDTQAKVRTLINQTGGAKPITLDYYLEKDGSRWKVIDIEVGGISLVTNYRDTFAGVVRNEGIDGLIATLQRKNRNSTAVEK